jgi:16S rRNA (adenine(1408)-N(1))-methyltransferase
VTIDVGTGDGRAVLAIAAAEPTTLVIGMDAVASSMAEASRRAARAAAKGGLRNALFVVASAEAPPSELRAIADRVTVLFPWGSLLRGCLGVDAAVAAGIAGLLAAGGDLDLLLAPAARDGLAGVPAEPVDIGTAAAAAFGPHGLSLVEARVATDAEIRASRSTWARRLLPGGPPDRPVTLVRLRS